MRNNYLDEILIYGKEVLESKYFKRAKYEPHHFQITIAEHSMNLARSCLNCCDFLEKFGIRTKREELVIACLCHDLGLLDRKERYVCGPHQAIMHGSVAVGIAKEILGNVTPLETEIIERHMFPLFIIPPTSIEGNIMQLLDKFCAIQEILGLAYNYDFFLLGGQMVKN